MNKIKAMAETLKKMEIMQKSVTEVTKVDIEDKREEAVKKIFKYLDDLSASLCGVYVEVEVPTVDVIWTLRHDNMVAFNAHRPLIGNACGDPIEWCYKSPDGHYHKDDYLYNYFDRYTTIRDSKGKVRREFVKLVENWSVIKETIETGIENELNKKMDNIREKTEQAIRSYGTVDNFEA